MTTYEKLEAMETKILNEEKELADDDPRRDELLHDLTAVQAMMMGCDRGGSK